MKQKKTERRDTYGSPRWSNEFLDCSMPMTFDTYNLCSYRCQYCFSYYQRSHAEDYMSNHLKWVNVDKVKKIFLEPESSQFCEYVKARKPMQWGGLSEPFDLQEPRHKVGLELLKFFREIDYPVAFSTKSTWFAYNDEYRKVLKGADNFHFKWSIITLDEEKAKKIEVGVPSPRERLKAMEEINKLGVAGVVLRLRPFMIGISDPTYLDLIREAKKAGAHALTTEFFCLDLRAADDVKQRYVNMSKVAGFDIYKFYKKYSSQQGYLRLNYEVKRKYVDKMRALCKELDMGFFVSDAHHKDKCDHGSCCALPIDNPKFANYAKAQFTEAIVIARKKGEVKFSDITKFEHKFLSDTRWNDATGLNSISTGARAKNYKKTLFDLMRHKWNNPKEGSSPWKYFDRVLIPDRLDENGDVVYRFNYKKAQCKGCEGCD